MQNKYNQFFNFFLFSGLACFSYLSLVLIYRPYASTSENINLLSGIYFCGVHIQSGRLQSDSHQPVAEKKLSILYQEEKQADYQLHFDCSYSFLHELRYSDHL